MDETVKTDEPKVLLTQGEDGKLKAIAGEQYGKLKTVNPTKENADQFMKIDTNGNALENFFKKFSAQYSHPSHTGVYAVSASAVDKVAAFLDKIIRIDHTDKALAPYRVKPDETMQEQGEGKYQPLDLNKLDRKEVEKLDLSGEKLQDALKAMVYGHKSPDCSILSPLLTDRSLRCRLAYYWRSRRTVSKSLPTPNKSSLILKSPLWVWSLPRRIKEQFQKNGHGGRVFELEPIAGGEKIPSLISLNKMTNRFEAVALKDIYIPQTLKNALLSEET